MRTPLTFKNEFKRKIIHLSSLIYPIVYLLFGKSVTLWVLGLVFSGLLLWEGCRRTKLQFKILFIFNSVLRPHEVAAKKATGAFWMLLSFIIVVSLFNRHTAILAMFITCLADTAASLVGKLRGGKIFGQSSYFTNLNKSAEGLLAFILTAIIILSLYSLYTTVNLLVLYISALVASLLELYSNKIKLDDNFIITIGFATTAALLY